MVQTPHRFPRRQLRAEAGFVVDRLCRRRNVESVSLRHAFHPASCVLRLRFVQAGTIT